MTLEKELEQLHRLGSRPLSAINYMLVKRKISRAAMQEVRAQVQSLLRETDSFLARLEKGNHVG